MGSRIVLAALSLLLLAVPLPGAAGSIDDLPSVARPRFKAGGREAGSGTVFFLKPQGSSQAFAVGAAHSFDLAALATSKKLEFRLGRSGRVVAASSRYLTQPGPAMGPSGENLGEDFVVFALDDPPQDVRILKPDPAGLPRPGERVRILGVPAAIARDEDDIFGTVSRVALDRIDVDLDVPVDLRGWGGAPVINYETGHVVGILEAAWPEAGKMRLGVAPIGAVVRAIASPLDGGKGAPFARFAGKANGRGARATRATPSPAAGRAGSPPRQPVRTARAEPPSPPPSQPPQALSKSTRQRPGGETLLGQAGAVDAKLVVEIEHPGENAVVGDAAGAFVAGRAIARLGTFRRFDVVLVIDTSGSAAQMSGSDINGNGVVGQGGFRGIFGKTDGGDSILAAEVAAARQLLRGLDPRSTRVALITFAGEPPRDQGFFGRGGRAAAITEEPLTADYQRIERALDRVLGRGAEGMTHMAAGVDQATTELLGLRGSLSQPDPESEKVVMFLTDGQPTLPYDAIFEADNVRAVLRAADRAARAQIKVHSFAIGPEALEGPIATVELAERTEGYFTPVRHPGDIVEVIENVNFANIEGLEVRNLTTDTAASQIITQADGRWGALVPLQAGRNRIEVVARGEDGSTARAEMVVQYAPGAPDPVLPPRLVAQRNRLLEQRLLELKRARLEAEREQIEQTRQELVIEIERERNDARERADRQRKELEIEAERPPGGGP